MVVLRNIPQGQRYEIICKVVFVFSRKTVIHSQFHIRNIPNWKRCYPSNILSSSVRWRIGGLLVNQNYRVGIIFHIIKCAAATASVGEKRTFKLARIGAFWGKFFENNLV